MKKILALILALSMILVLFAACTPKIEDIALDKTEVVLTAGESFDAVYSVTPEKAEGEVYWSSDDETVATVDQSGHVTAQGAGVCVVTVTADTGIAAAVMVEVLPALEAVEADVEALELYLEETYTLDITTAPLDAIAELSYSSSDESVATVEDGTITAIADGTATITVTAQNGLKAEVQVTVSSLTQAERDLVGSYSIDILVSEGQYYLDAQAVMEIYRDYTGSVTAGDGTTMAFTWSYQSALDTQDSHVFYAEAEGETYLLLNFHSGDNAGYLALYFDESNMMLFLRDE